MEELVRELQRQGVLKTPALVRAFLKNDRADFVSAALRDEAYVDAPLPIGPEQTISQPYTVAFMLELLAPEPGQKVLDIGFGSGWTTALLAELVGPAGTVYALEIAPDVYEFGKCNLEKYAYPNVHLFNQSGWAGLPEFAPFARILVSAAAQEFPAALKDQLEIGGRLVIPVGANINGGQENLLFGQSIRLTQKLSARRFAEKDYPGFAFVPLVK